MDSKWGTVLGGDCTKVLRADGLGLRFLRRDLGVFVLRKEVENGEETKRRAL